MQNNSQRHNDKNRREKTSLTNMYLSLYLWRLRCERELKTEQNCNILTPTLMAVSVVSFSFSMAAQPEAQKPTLLGDGFLYCILSATSLDPNSSGAPRVPLVWRGFPYHSYRQLFSNCNSSCLTSVLTELYNSSTPTQSSTRSLEWHVWSSSNGNNCHAVHRSLSSGASVYECTMGILACSILFANFRSRDFLS